VLFGALAALAAALCWTLASGLWRRLSTSLSGAELNLLKNWLALVMLLPLVLGRPWPAAPGALVLLALSGVLGIALGDSLYFAALRRLGTRRTLTIDAGGPAVAALGGLVWLAAGQTRPAAAGTVPQCQRRTSRLRHTSRCFDACHKESAIPQQR